MLLVDIGNSRVKWARYERGQLGEQSAAAYSGWTIDDWRRTLFQPPGIDDVLVASVAGEASAALFTEATRLETGGPAAFVATSREAGGVRNAYPEPRLLGVDRWLATIAGYQAGSWRVLRRRHRHRCDAGRSDRRRSAPRWLHRAGTGTDDAIALARDFGPCLAHCNQRRHGRRTVCRQHARRHRARLSPGSGGDGRSCRRGDDEPPGIDSDAPADGWRCWPASRGCSRRRPGIRAGPRAARARRRSGRARARLNSRGAAAGRKRRVASCLGRLRSDRKDHGIHRHSGFPPVGLRNPLSLTRFRLRKMATF